MSKENSEGVWRTIRGRRIFIGKGEDLATAMKNSGKFNDNGRLPKREDVMKGKKELKRQEATEKWHKAYDPKKHKAEEYNTDEGRAKIRKSQEKADKDFEKAHKDKDDFMELYDKDTPENELTWQDRVERNNRETNKKTRELEEQRGKGQYTYHEDKWADDYYGKFRENEERNAKIKEEPENAPYEPIQAYKGYKEKFDKLSEKGTWTGKEYTNDEFMEHLEDANWHHERKMIEEAGLTNKQMTELKNQVKLSQWSADLDPKKTQELIDKVKKEFPAKDTKKTIEDFKAKKQSNNKIENQYISKLKNGEEITIGGKKDFTPTTFKYEDGEFYYKNKEITGNTWGKHPSDENDITKHFQNMEKQGFKFTSNNKVESERKWEVKSTEGFGQQYGEGNIPIRDGQVDYESHFGSLGQDLTLLSDKELKTALETQQKMYDKYSSRPKTYDARTRNGRMERIFRDSELTNARLSVEALKKEKIRRENERQNDNNSLNNTFKFGNKKYNTRVEKNFDNYGRADKEEAINNEIEKTIKRYKQRKGK